MTNEKGPSLNLEAARRYQQACQEFARKLKNEQGDSDDIRPDKHKTKTEPGFKPKREKSASLNDAEIQRIADELQRLQDENQTLKDEISQLRNLIQSLTDQLNRLVQQIQDLFSQFTNLANQQQSNSAQNNANQRRAPSSASAQTSPFSGMNSSSVTGAQTQAGAQQGSSSAGNSQQNANSQRTTTSQASGQSNIQRSSAHHGPQSAPSSPVGINRQRQGISPQDVLDKHGLIKSEFKTRLDNLFEDSAQAMMEADAEWEAEKNTPGSVHNQETHNSAEERKAELLASFRQDMEQVIASINTRYFASNLQSEIDTLRSEIKGNNRVLRKYLSEREKLMRRINRERNKLKGVEERRQNIILQDLLQQLDQLDDKIQAKKQENEEKNALLNEKQDLLNKQRARFYAYIIRPYLEKYVMLKIATKLNTSRWPNVASMQRLLSGDKMLWWKARASSYESVAHQLLARKAFKKAKRKLEQNILRLFSAKKVHNLLVDGNFFESIDKKVDEIISRQTKAWRFKWPYSIIK